MSPEAQLRQRVADLEEENQYLRAIIAPVDVLPRAWKLSASGTRLVIALARAQGCLSRERVRLAASTFDRDFTDGSLEILLVRTRRALARQGIEIRAVRAVGLIMPPESRAIVLDALAAVTQARAA